MMKTVKVNPNQALIDLLQPYINELDRYPRPDRIDPKTGTPVEYGDKGDQHCPTIPLIDWDIFLAAEPFHSSKEWEYLRELRKKAVGRSREIPGVWLRAAYNLLNKKG